MHNFDLIWLYFSKNQITKEKLIIESSTLPSLSYLWLFLNHTLLPLLLHKRCKNSWKGNDTKLIPKLCSFDKST